MFRKERLQLKKRKNAALKVLLLSAFITFICLSMLVGTTYAWLTDSVTSGRNKIISGSLSMELNYLGDSAWAPANDYVFGDMTWEPGRIYYRAIEIKNNGDIPVKYSFKANVIDEHGSINTQGNHFYISQCIKSAQVTDPTYTSRDDFTGTWGNSVHSHIDAIPINGFAGFTELTGNIAANSAKYVLLILQMPSSGVEASTTKEGMPSPTFSIEVDVAVTQAATSDSFGDDVASNASIASVARPTKYYEYDTATGLYKTEENNVKTYYVSSKEDFNKFVTKVNGGASFDNSIVKLTADIDLKGDAASQPDWTQIASNFAGTFDGGYTSGTSTLSHVISNFKVSTDFGATEAVLFAGGTVTNLSVNNVEVTKAPADPSDPASQPTVTNITDAVSVVNGKIAV